MGSSLLSRTHLNIFIIVRNDFYIFGIPLLEQKPRRTIARNSRMLSFIDIMVT